MQNATSTKTRGSYLPVSEASPVLLNRNACVQLRSRYADCRNCERICPSGVLDIKDGLLRVQAGCLGCGRCMAACPTGALQVRGFFPALELAAGSTAPVSVDCVRAPRGGAEVRVPCLGGLSISQLISLRLAAGQRELALLDRGWCRDCPAAKGAKEHPVAKSLARVQARLRDAGLPERLLPRMKAAPLPASKKASDKALAPDLARRSIVSGLKRALQPVVEEGRFVAAAAPERERVLAGLAKLSARFGGRISEKLFNTVEINAEACEAHGVCAAGCPTGALRAQAERGLISALIHSTALCIGCGHCERVCPEKAVRLAYGAGDPGVARRVVAKFDSRRCDRCGARVAVADDCRGSRTVCARCAKSSALARAAFQQFHGSRAVDGV